MVRMLLWVCILTIDLKTTKTYREKTIESFDSPWGFCFKLISTCSTNINEGSLHLVDKQQFDFTIFIPMKRCIFSVMQSIFCFFFFIQFFDEISAVVFVSLSLWRVVLMFCFWSVLLLPLNKLKVKRTKECSRSLARITKNTERIGRSFKHFM